MKCLNCRLKACERVCQLKKAIRCDKRGFNRQAKDLADRQEREAIKRDLTAILKKLRETL
jgi:hypothetical protein